MNSLDKQEQPNDILSNLYALRAGLSLIYKEKLQLDEYEKNIKSQIDKNNSKCEENAQNLQQETTCLEEEVSQLTKERDDRPRFYTRVSPGIIFTRILTTLLLTLAEFILFVTPILIIGGIVISIIRDYGFEIDNSNAFLSIGIWVADIIDSTIYAVGYDWFTAIFLGLIIVIICIIGLLIRMTPGWFSNVCHTFNLIFNYSKYKNLGNQYDKETDHFNESIKKATDKLLHLKENRESILSELNSPFLDGNLDLQANFEQEKATKYSKISAINTSLQNTFSNFLDLRDWKHVDYLIFLFESNRVYSMHEALQRLDNYASYADIKNTIMESHNYLSNLINTSFNNLNVNIQNGLNRINSTLIKSAELTAINSQLICSKLNSLQVGIDDFISTQSLHNALIEQSNVDSQKLVENLEQLNDTIKDESYKIRSGYQY